MKMSLLNLTWIWLGLWCAAALALSVWQFLHRQWAPAVLLLVIGIAASLATGLCLWSLSGQGIPPEAVGSDARIVLQTSGEALAKTLAWASGFLILAVGLAQFPDLLWRKWLSYPAAFLALLLVGVMLVIAWSQKLERVLADAQGIEVCSELRGVVMPGTKVAWSQVGAVKRIEVWGETYQGAVSMQGRETQRHFLGSEFVLTDRNGAELLSLEEPLDPPARYRQLLESIPSWTGLAVQDVKVTK